ncbi:hypothetical protein [Roseivirga misakiensis]|uniref:Uncharacterized protein n=1 Tax=Roseivirga misakiensis TaxID=1563681 RepID=A0A1E5T5N1_9BACT|nr:hypothetical protein [Roseivirga misakiensis]OEK06670.1 hypothetical protein BFP71_03115 [Roseivirga misakiensis]
MKFQEGKFIAKMKSGDLYEKTFFMKVWFQSGSWFLKVDDGKPQKITEEIRDNIVQEIDMVTNLSDDYRPAFKKVKVTIEATSDKGTEHIWTRVNGEALEKLLKVFPGLVNRFWADTHRKEKIDSYLSLKHHKPKSRKY